MKTHLLWLCLLALILSIVSLLIYRRVADQQSNPAQSQALVAGHPEDLSRSFVYAVQALRHHQTSAGFWTTSVTSAATFKRPAAEVNVFVPALVIDLLEPIARETGLTDVAERARGYLRDQIEESGLVRYHGKPAQSAALAKGCELPPDADDTALVWRLAAKSDQSLLAAARRELKRYKTAGGLYQTWLADQKTYRCFYDKYSGKERNPTDVAIQMHLQLFFAQYDRDAARALCAALGAQISDPAIWVWYAVAPLVPLLREADLSRAGCTVQIPSNRIQEAADGQKIYLSLGQLLRNLLMHSEPGLTQPSLQPLQQIAEKNFFKLSQSPPLLYHNDLSAKPPHFHWSEDVGYALWLRLYAETARRWPDRLQLPNLSSRQ